MKLIVRNLSRATPEVKIKELFEGFGRVQSCNLVMDSKSGLSKGFGFVEMPRPGEAKAAMKNLNGKELDGCLIRVKKAVPKAAPLLEPEDTDAVESDVLMAEVSKVEAPKTDSAKAKAPKVKAPKAKAPKVAEPKSEAIERPSPAIKPKPVKETDSPGRVNHNVWKKS